MARYSQFLGVRVEVQYRAGDIVLPASGVFVADSGRSIFLEQKIEQRGPKHFRWEIPYQCLVKIEQTSQIVAASGDSTNGVKGAVLSEGGESKQRSAAAARASAGGLLSLGRKAETA